MSEEKYSKKFNELVAGLTDAQLDEAKNNVICFGNEPKWMRNLFELAGHTLFAIGWNGSDHGYSRKTHTYRLRESFKRPEVVRFFISYYDSKSWYVAEHPKDECIASSGESSGGALGDITLSFDEHVRLNEEETRKITQTEADYIINNAGLMDEGFELRDAKNGDSFMGRHGNISTWARDDGFAGLDFLPNLRYCKAKEEPTELEKLGALQECHDRLRDLAEQARGIPSLIMDEVLHISKLIEKESNPKGQG